MKKLHNFLNTFSHSILPPIAFRERENSSIDIHFHAPLATEKWFLMFLALAWNLNRHKEVFLREKREFHSIAIYSASLRWMPALLLILREKNHQFQFFFYKFNVHFSFLVPFPFRPTRWWWCVVCYGWADQVARLWQCEFVYDLSRRAHVDGNSIFRVRFSTLGYSRSLFHAFLSVFLFNVNTFLFLFFRFYCFLFTLGTFHCSIRPFNEGLI